jgi:hypothetical protein
MVIWTLLSSFRSVQVIQLGLVSDRNKEKLTSLLDFFLLKEVPIVSLFPKEKSRMGEDKSKDESTKSTVEITLIIP